MPPPSASELEARRQALEGLAYRMLGSWADAQDIAQETLLKWHAQTDSARAAVRSPRSWLMKVATRLALDQLKSAQRQREHYVGPWLPEPWLVQDDTPAQQAIISESVTMALMLALERLSPAERATFILHDVFNFPFSEVAEILGKNVPGCRKLASRARAAVRAGKPRYDLDPATHQRLLAAFLHASEAGDMNALKQVLAEDVILYSDGGGIAPAARKRLETRDIVGRLFIGVARKARTRGALPRIRLHVVNGLPAALIYIHERLETLLSVSIHGDGRIHSVFQQRNPEKLERLGRLVAGDLAPHLNEDARKR